MSRHFALSVGLAICACLPLSACQDNGSTSADYKAEQNIDDRAQNILAQMTIEEKIGQIIQADISAVTPEEVKTYNLGSVLNGGNSAPGGGVIAPPEDWVALADSYWIASTDTSDGGVGVPLIWGTDAVHGHNNLQNATIFPHNIGLGAMNNPDLMRRIGEVTAREIRATGIDWTFAPTLAVAQDDRWGRAYESYSENPDIVARYSSAIVQGLQGEKGSDGFLVGENVLATAKHFVADGGTQFGIDKGDTIGELEDILAVHAAGYQPAFDKGVKVVMASFSSINGDKMHGHKYLLNDVLRDRMGFDGFVVGDWNGHGEIPGCTTTDCPQSLIAGVDMYMAPDSWKGVYDSLLEDAKQGTLDTARLDEAVLRILKVKIESGLFEAGLPSQRASTVLENLGRQDHRAIARQAVRESLVLLKNDGVLPIKSNATVLLTGSGADSMQQQTGGWTLSWQGDSNANDVFETGESIYSGIASVLEAGGGTAILSADGSFTDTPDVVIVVFGEQPYAEYRGDRSDLVFEFEDGENLALIRSFKEQNIPVVSVFLTGRPLWMNPHLNASDAFVVAWLPGTEAGGVADVLIGDETGNARHDFKGRLSFSWPSDGTGKPINDPNDPGVLYAFGYGLTYGSDSVFTTLSEDPGVENTGSEFDGTIVSRGDAKAPFSMYLGDSSNWNTPATSLLASSLGGRLSIKGSDYKEQEDARVLAWNGQGEATMDIKTLRPIDMSVLGETNELSLNIHWKIDKAADDDLRVGMGCGDGCEAEVNLAEALKSSKAETWQTTEIPLSCFENAGLDTTAVDKVLSLSSDNAATITLYSAEFSVKSNDAVCPG